MRRETALECGEAAARRIGQAIKQSLMAKRGELAGGIESFIEALWDFLKAACEDEEERRLARLEETAVRLFREGMGGFEMAKALCEAAGAEGGEAWDAPIFHELLKAQTRVMKAWERAEREKREEKEGHLAEIERFPDTIAATLDPATLARLGLERLKSLTGAEKAAIYHYEERGIFVSDSSVSREIPGKRLVLEGEAESILLHEKTEYQGGDMGSAGVCLDGVRADTPGRLFLPMVVRGRTTGVIMLELGPGKSRPESDALNLARRFADRMAVALENAGLHAREQRKIRETVALLELARAINSTLDLGEILEKVASMSVNLCGVVECEVYIIDKEGGRFCPGARCGFLAGGGGVEEPTPPRLRELGGDTLRSLAGGEPVLIGTSEAEAMFSRRDLYEHGVDLVLLHPLKSRERLSGILALFYPSANGEGPDREEEGLIAAIAAQASMAIENAYLYEDIEKSYYSTIKALARAIEVKDPYTHGHSERVTEYALLVAEAMRLDERERQKLKYAATLHDIGKIGIAGRVLNKPGALTEEEYTHVKTHPLLGDSIIEPVEFLQEPRPIILHHHERYDGKGYPDGLKGENIPLCARILSVADAFEAMRSDRPYRRALPLEDAVGELKRNAGTQFDPGVVKVFLNILEGYGGDPVNR